jgi:hypothetical protein
MNCLQVLIPGSIVKAKGHWPMPDHSGIVGYALSGGAPAVVDSTEIGVRVRTFQEFALDREIEVLWIPQTFEQQDAALNRAYSQIGTPTTYSARTASIS